MDRRGHRVVTLPMIKGMKSTVIVCLSIQPPPPPPAFVCKSVRTSFFKRLKMKHKGCFYNTVIMQNYIRQTWIVHNSLPCIHVYICSDRKRESASALRPSLILKARSRQIGGLTDDRPYTNQPPTGRLGHREVSLPIINL